MRTIILAFILGSSTLAHGQLDVTLGSTNDGRTTISYKNTSTVRLTAFVTGWIATEPGLQISWWRTVADV